MKTLMQELIEKFNTSFDKQKFLDYFRDNKDKLLELEKQQIVQAVDRMTNRLIANEIITEAGCTDDSTYGKIYYNQTFNKQS